MTEVNIRLECLRPASDGWQQPTAEEVREVLRHAGFTESETAQLLGLGEKGGRTVRRWKSGESGISYANWAILCDLSGLGIIWRKD